MATVLCVEKIIDNKHIIVKMESGVESKTAGRIEHELRPVFKGDQGENLRL